MREISHDPGLAATAVPTGPAVAPDARRARAIGQGALACVGAGAALLALRTISIHAPPCPFRTVTGLPCPGCGMTRLADAVAHGRLHTAVHADVAGVAILGVLLVLAATHVATTVRRRPPAAWMRSMALPALLVLLVGAHWITTIITGGLPSS
ncbi:DUF2752 domain-containing protein [Aquihabitans sp. McL0605]|uniref:DUF2752 domain-containing protein n=1 Tax=Aquihabitans sp. McL0605 TaxID=3415671 RepID=UPI003CEE3DCF